MELRSRILLFVKVELSQIFDISNLDLSDCTTCVFVLTWYLHDDTHSLAQGEESMMTDYCTGCCLYSRSRRGSLDVKELSLPRKRLQVSYSTRVTEESQFAIIPAWGIWFAVTAFKSETSCCFSLSFAEHSSSAQSGRHCGSVWAAIGNAGGACRRPWNGRSRTATASEVVHWMLYVTEC